MITLNIYPFFFENYLFNIFIYINLFNNRQVPTEEAEKRAKELNIMFMETSAKAGHNVFFFIIIIIYFSLKEEL